jgi:hypothetical protein
MLQKSRFSNEPMLFERNGKGFMKKLRRAAGGKRSNPSLDHGGLENNVLPVWMTTI